MPNFPKKPSPKAVDPSESDLHIRTVDDPSLIGDPFRREFGVLSEGRKADVQALKFHYENVWIALEKCRQVYGLSRDLQIACTELQTSCMWAVRALTDPNPPAEQAQRDVSQAN